jgi:hypothetical protein
MNSLALSGSIRINSTAFGANAARPSMDARHVCLKVLSSLIRSVTSTDLPPSQLYFKRSFGCLVFAAQDQYRITHKICRDDLGTAIRWRFAFLN